MARQVELVSGALAGALGLVIAANVYSTLGNPVLEAQYVLMQGGANGARHYLAIYTVLVLGIAAGAYLHGLLRRREGLVLLRVSTGLLLLGALYAVVTGDPAIGVFNQVGLLTGAMWLPTAEALTLVFAVVAALADVPVPVREDRTAGEVQGGTDWLPGLEREPGGE